MRLKAVRTLGLDSCGSCLFYRSENEVNAQPATKKMTSIAVLIVAAILLSTTTHAASIPLTLVSDGTSGGTTIFKADLTTLSITEIASLTVTDSNSQTGGQGGIFSGFDLDAVFLDGDGLLTTSGDRTFGSAFVFNAGTTRSTTNPNLLPNTSHPGPTFGSLSDSVIDLATATLNDIDGVAVADVDVAAGFLTLGDGGSLGINFSPGVSIPSSLFLVLGEVGTTTGELVDASVTISDQTIPVPATVVLLGLGALGIGIRRRRLPVKH